MTLSTTSIADFRNAGYRASKALRQPLTLPFSPWQILAIVMLATPWLLPLHVDPWRAFHADAAMAVAIWLIAFVLLVRHDRQSTKWPTEATVASCVAAVPLIQMGFGLHSFAGTAIISAAYLVGFAGAIYCGARWQTFHPSQAMDTILAAVCVASILSVAVQLSQWLGVYVSDLRTALPAGARPFGNLAQPNQLALLLTWGLIAICWAHASGRIGGVVAALAAWYLASGLIMTQSRTTWLAMAALIVIATIWRSLLAPGVRWAIVALAAYVWLGSLTWATVNDLLLLQTGRASTEQFQAGGRSIVWPQLIEAVMQRPWFGWGWGQVTLAQVSVAASRPATYEVYPYAHNWVLDFLLDNGVILGGVLTFAVIGWFVLRSKQVKTAADAMPMAALLVFGVHAMFEFPHTYAYFLLPAGLMVGVLSEVAAASNTENVGRPWFARFSLVGSAALLCWLIIEAAEAEHRLQVLRMEQQRIGVNRNTPPVTTALLTQLAAQQSFMKTQIKSDMTAESLVLMRKVAYLHPSGNYLLYYAKAAAQNQQPAEAEQALLILCKVSPPAICEAARSHWRDAATKSEELSRVKLPD